MDVTPLRPLSLRNVGKRNKRSPQCGALSRAVRESRDYGSAVRVLNRAPIEAAFRIPPGSFQDEESNSVSAGIGSSSGKVYILERRCRESVREAGLIGLGRESPSQGPTQNGNEVLTVHIKVCYIPQNRKGRESPGKPAIKADRDLWHVCSCDRIKETDRL